MVRCQAFTGLPQLTTRVLNGTIQFRRMFHWSAAPTFSSSAQGMRSTAGASLLVVVAGLCQQLDASRRSVRAGANG